MFYGEYVWLNIIFLILGYLIGSFNLAIIITKLRGNDIRKIGSQNPGATNALRNFGIKFAALVFAFDIFKAFLATIIAFLIKKYLKNLEYIFPMLAGLGAVIGHVFPVYFKFKGGKGVACFFGIMLAYNFLLFLIFVAIYVILVFSTKYVSLASSISCGIIPYLGLIYIFYAGTIFGYMQQNVVYPTHVIILILASLIIVVKHIPNFKRIFKHTEPKIFSKQKKHKNIDS